MTSNRKARQEFVGLITFRPSRGKVVACLSFLRLLKLQRPEIMEIDEGTVLLLAEASHLSAFGRPVTGCSYDLVDGAWRPELAAEAAELRNPAGRLAIPTGDAACVMLGDGQVPEAMEVTFPDLSRSDMDHILQAATALHSDPANMAQRISNMLHEGSPDYALMLEEDDPDMLARKLEDLAAWSRHFYLGRRD